VIKAKYCVLRLFPQNVVLARSLAPFNAGRSMEIKIIMIDMTTMSSISVKFEQELDNFDHTFFGFFSILMIQSLLFRAFLLI